MTKPTLVFLVFFFLPAVVVSQPQLATATGSVTDALTQQPLPGASVILQGTDPLIGSTSDEKGNFRISCPPGSYTFVASLVGYKPLSKFNVVVTTGNVNTLNFNLEQVATSLDAVVVTAAHAATVATVETPLSVQQLTAEEIRSNPGGNFDISRVIQTLPGVGGGNSFGGVRNDIIIRGGAPNENVFYLDGIEVPVINHFSTQGSSGGPQGILNVSFIEDVTLSSSAFGARFDNALSSVFEFKQREGNPERLQGNVRLSGTELATTFDGPLSDKTTFLASARRSYLQWFFQLIDLPIRPSYWDFQYKVTHRFNAKTTLTAIGVAALDDFSFAVPKESTPEKEYAIRSGPTINQDSYTVGASVKRLVRNGFVNVALSRNYLNNRLDKFEDGQTGVEALRTLRARSAETENKLRVDVNQFKGDWKYAYGMMAQYADFGNNFFSQVAKELRDTQGNLLQPAVFVDMDTDLSFFRYGFFGQLSRSLLDNRLSISAGVRTDLDTFTDNGSKPLKSLSPRISFSYAVDARWNINTSVGRYYKIPIYTVLGFQDASGSYVNRDNAYIRSDHFVTGLEFLPDPSLRFTLEGFYKRYEDYPVSVRTGTSLANEGADFGFVGNEAVRSEGQGRVFGLELFAQKKLTKSIFYSVAYTLYRSEFSNADGSYAPSAWDNRHLLSMLLGQKLKKGWELGLKFRYAGGAPYTPYDMAASRLNYLSLGVGVEDISQLNTRRLSNFRQVDLRVDKKWNYRRFTFDLYLDVQNVFVANTPEPPFYTFERNEDGTYLTSDNQPVAADGSNAIPLLLDDSSPFFVPTIGFILEF